MRLIFISGYAKSSVHDIAASVSARMNFKHISYFDVMKSALDGRCASKAGKEFRSSFLDSNVLDNEIFDELVRQLKEAGEGKHFTGCILEGFPNNLVRISLGLCVKGVNRRSCCT